MSINLILIHGMWGGAWHWDNYTGLFRERGYECIPVTLRHHDIGPGEKPDPALGTTSLLDYADDLSVMIAGMDARPVIVGHSMGGLIAQILGTMVDARALVLLSPAPPAGINAFRPSVVRSFLSIFRKRGFWKRPILLTFEEASYALFNALPEKMRRPAYDRFVFESGRAASEIGFWFLDRQGAASVDEKKIACPILVTGSKKDRITPVRVVRKIAEKYGDLATYIEFEGHAHWVTQEPGWEEIAGSVADWLDSLDSRNSGLE